jgi:hypothetical protein
LFKRGYADGAQVVVAGLTSDTLEHCFGEPSDKNNSGQKHSFGYLNLLHRQLRERERERENIDPSQGNMLDEA